MRLIGCFRPHGGLPHGDQAHGGLLRGDRPRGGLLQTNVQ